ncbi:MAG: RHS repeat-associated core domain-containing protein, partial [Chloroflexota bacterium]
AERYAYDVYGTPRITDAGGTVLSQSALGNRFLFTGREYDQETGLYHYRARAYDPKLGRFLQRDPVGYVAGLNLYTYVGNSPMNWLDPLGLEKHPGRAGFWQGLMVDPLRALLSPMGLALLAAGIGATLALAVPGLALGAAVTLGALVFFGGVSIGLALNAAVTGQSFTGQPLGAYDRGRAAGQATFGLATLAAGALVGRGGGGGGVTSGTKVYRVFGGEATPFGNPAGGSFTTVNPATVGKFREAAGLYPGNTGRFVMEAQLINTESVTVRQALPGPGGIGGGLTEVVIPNAENQVQLLRVSGANPEF